ncbi:MAG: hypothetical protein CMH31_01040 [Micavibrio sp.]|nr:hypothetical protein [Micavibrio sp.]|tara:strand:+ start:13 stop:336 length:324 start_codon:yes stop_codon:yes gene_type:complete
MKILFIILIAFIVQGCSNYRVIDMQQKNYLQFKPSEKQSVDYEFIIKNVFDVGFDGDLQSDRENLIFQVLSAECSNGVVVVNEKSIQSGTWLTGKPIRNYYSDVNCK